MYVSIEDGNALVSNVCIKFTFHINVDYYMILYKIGPVRKPHFLFSHDAAHVSTMHYFAIIFNAQM